MCVLLYCTVSLTTHGDSCRCSRQLAVVFDVITAVPAHFTVAVDDIVWLLLLPTSSLQYWLSLLSVWTWSTTPADCFTVHLSFATPCRCCRRHRCSICWIYCCCWHHCSLTAVTANIVVALPAEFAIGVDVVNDNRWVLSLLTSTFTTLCLPSLVRGC